MITVKIFGTFRLDSGLKQMQADVKSAKELYPLIMDEVKRIDPNTKLTIKDVKGCILSRGGKQISPSTRLDDGDDIFRTVFRNAVRPHRLAQEADNLGLDTLGNFHHCLRAYALSARQHL